jgi:glycosyltransferase involved in cell wall biosynthesis
VKSNRSDATSPHRVYYDGLIYNLYQSRPGGISNFFDHLISSVSHHHPCLLTSRRAASLPHPIGPQLTIARHNLTIRPGRVNEKLWRFRFAQRATRFRPNLIHCTFYGKPLIMGSKAPVIYTAYDMIVERWKHQLDPSGESALLKKQCFEAAAAIPCISESTRNDLLALYPQLEPKVSVIHLAGDLKGADGLNAMDSRTDTIPRTDQAAPYLLYVGARSSYKNFIRLALAFARVSAQLPNLQLHLVGASFTSEEVDLLEALAISNKVIMHADLGDAKLYNLYRGALAFVYPSLYEGFGIPPLEAMALDTPVLAANTSSLPEVTGDAALLFNPSSVEAIVEAILRIAREPGLREDLIRKGRRQLQRFSWEKTAAAYLDLYASVAAQHSR